MAGRPPSRPRTMLGAILQRCAEEEGGDMRMDPPGGTLHALADEIDVDPSTLRDWMRGTASPTGAALRKLARYLEASLDDIAAWADTAEHFAGRSPERRCH